MSTITELNLEATFYSREETQGHPPATGIFGSTLQEAINGQGRLQCAVDPAVIPLETEFTLRLWDGTEVPAAALDVGTAIIGQIVDIFVDTVDEAINLGRKNVTALIPNVGDKESILKQTTGFFMNANANDTSQESQTQKLLLTFYGFPDNDPAGNIISYPKIHQVAGGTGTYEDPITVAIVTTQNGGNWAPGTIMYLPYLKKYLIVEDECATCVPDQIDVWMNSDSNFSSEVLQCQKTWTPKEPVEVEINPPTDREVITTPLFDTSTGKCSNPN